MLVELIYTSSHRYLELWSASSVKRSTQFPLVLVFIIQHNIARGKTERTNEQHMSRIRDIMHKCLIRAFSHELGVWADTNLPYFISDSLKLALIYCLLCHLCVVRRTFALRALRGFRFVIRVPVACW